MKYRESHRDKQLRSRFANDNAHALLRRIVLKEGVLRGLNALDIKFQYPITAIAGKNGAGKSTILALACCAYHNARTGFKLPKRKNTYYTFSDFFVQSLEEASPQGVTIDYYIAYNKWKKTPGLPEGVGLGMQRRSKKKGGKWNDYDKRVNKNVVFLALRESFPIVNGANRAHTQRFSAMLRQRAGKTR
jgi:AAA15 family ATPase/GTPase